jgi:hypothetical protein
MKKITLFLFAILTTLIAIADPYLDVTYTGYSGGAYAFTLVNHQTCAADFNVSTSGTTITSISPSPHGNTNTEGTAPAGTSTFLMYGAFVQTATFTFLDQTICTWEGQEPTSTIVGPVFNDLPVLFTNVSARLNSGTLTFQWTSTMESNNSFYTVQGSADGVTWDSVGQIASYWPGGTSSTPHTYIFTYNDLTVVYAGIGIGLLIYMLYVALAFWLVPKLFRRFEKLFMMAGVVIVILLTSCHKTNTVASKEQVRYSYFRLTQTDLDGNVSYYQTIFKVN